MSLVESKMSDVTNWIPTSFSGPNEAEGDKLNFLPAETAPGESTEPTPDDQSFDLISRQKLSLTPRPAAVASQDRSSPKGAPTTLFEDDTRSSWSVESAKNAPLKESAVDDDSQNSLGSQKSAAQKRRYSDEEAASSFRFPPENLFEYMWPMDKGDFFFLQEQISDYLSVKSFKRKYPDLVRRTVDKGEKQFLKDRGVVSETQCELGLTALRSEDVLELMNKDYPNKYAEYIRVLREKEKQNLTEKHKEYASTVDRNKMGDVAKKAMKSAAEYNAHLNQERREERRCCFDLQTFTVHYPTGRKKVTETVKFGKYPVALLPGQFQDNFKEFTSEELKYLPLNTVLYGPLQEIKNAVQPLSDGSRSDSEESTGSDGSCSSSQGTHDDGSGESSSGSEKNEKSHASNASNLPANEKTPAKSTTPYKAKDKPNAICKVCKLKSGVGKDEKNESMVHCSECESSGHPTCLQLTLDMIDVLKTYPWQCMDCKTCVHCRDPYDEDKMLFCDICDRGYHTFCVGLKNLPQGKWICKLCGRCSMCNASEPGLEGSKAQWQYSFVAPSAVGSEHITPSRRRKIVCVACSKRKH